MFNRNNYCEIFQLSHSAEKYPKGFSPKLENSFFQNWKHQKKLSCLSKKNSKKVFSKKVAYCAEIPKEKPFRLMKRFFLQTESFNKNQAVPFAARIQKFFEKSRIVPKKPKGGPFGLPSTFGSIGKCCGLVPLFLFSQTVETYRVLTKETGKI